jgi:hypothetical protein
MTTTKRPRGRPLAAEFPAEFRRLAITLPPEAYDDVRRLATADGRPIATWIRRVVLERLEAERTLGSVITPPGPPAKPSGLADSECSACEGSGLANLPGDEDDGSCWECGGTGLAE